MPSGDFKMLKGWKYGKIISVIGKSENLIRGNNEMNLTIEENKTAIKND